MRQKGQVPYGRDIMIALDVAASELYIEGKGDIFSREKGKKRTCRADDRKR